MRVKPYYNPGPGNRRDNAPYQAEWALKSRTYDGVITTINTELGLAKVRLQGISDEPWVQVAGLGGLSVPVADGAPQGTRGAWRRFMPHPDTGVTVNFTPDGACRVQSFHTTRESLADAPDSGGQRNLGYGFYQQKANAAEYGLRPMVELQPGEWHDRSSGGAEVYGRATGTLDLVGGVARISIRKADDSVRGEAQSWDLSDGIATRVEFGVVPGPSNAQSVVPLDPETPPVRRMFRAWIGPKTPNQAAMEEQPPTPGAEAPPTADPIPPVLHFRMEGGELEADEQLEGSPVRFLVSGRDAAGAVETWGLRASVLGDWEISTQPGNAVKVTAAGVMTVDALQSYELNTLAVALGTGAREPVIKAQLFKTWLESSFSCLTAFGPSGPALPAATAALEAAFSQVVEVA